MAAAEGACLTEDGLLELLERGLDAGLREDLRRHLDGCAACRALVAAGIQEVRGGPVRRAPRRAPAPKAGPDYLATGTRVGDFVIERILGEGAMGVVYRARHRKTREPVALKLGRAAAGARLDASLEELQARLRREGRILESLEHPNVVGVREVGVFQGEVFLAMALVEGEPLDAWLERTSPSPRRVIELFLQLGAGIAAAHAAGVVHRDLKPGNVIVERRSGRAVVLDFGLASEDRVVEPGAPLGAATFVTATGMHVGTPAYMAPEQLAGRPASAASDQFSFAVMLYEALFGQRAFGGRSMKQYLDHVRAGEVAQPEADAPGRPWFEPLARALSRDPKRRYPSLDALLAALSV